MPTISAPALVEGFQSDGGNVWLPGIGSGLEPQQLATKIPNHAAVFVVESNWSDVRMVLQLHDLAPMFDAGRIVLLDEKNLANELIALVRAHPGFELPRQMLFPPWILASKHSSIQRSIEDVSATAAAEQMKLLRETAEKLAKRARESTTGRARPVTARKTELAIVSADPRPDAIRQARRLARSAEELGHHVHLHFPDGPSRCHLAGRLLAIVDADLVLVVGSGASSLSAWTHRALPIGMWMVDETPVEALGDWASAVHWFAPSRQARGELIDAGVRSERVSICEPACDVHATEPARLSPKSLDAWASDITVVVDLPDDRHEDAGIALPSHIELWERLRGNALALARANRNITANALLENAMRQSHVHLNDPSLRDHWLQLIGTRILPVAPLVALVESLRQTDNGPTRRIRAVGHGWAHHLIDGVVTNEYPVDSPTWKLLSAATRSVVFPRCTPFYVEKAMEALSAGARVFLASPDAGFATEYPRLAEVAPLLSLFKNRSELGARIDEGASKPVASPRHDATQILSAHSLAKRLQWAIDQLQHHAQ